MKFYLPILIILIISVTSIQRRRKDIKRRIAQSLGLYKHEDNSIDMLLPGEKEDVTTPFIFQEITQDGIMIKYPPSGIPPQYQQYFIEKGKNTMMLPYLYIREFLNENHGHPTKNFHCMIGLDDRSPAAKLSIYLPEQGREKLLDIIWYNKSKCNVIGYSIQLHCKLQLYADQYRNKCQNMDPFKMHLLVQFSEYTRNAIKEIVKEFNWSKTQEHDFYSSKRYLGSYPTPGFFGSFTRKETVPICENDKVLLNVKDDTIYDIEEVGKEGLKEARKLLKRYLPTERIKYFNRMHYTKLYDEINHIFRKNEFLETLEIPSYYTIN